jgi:hypothetical protein
MSVGPRSARAVPAGRGARAVSGRTRGSEGRRRERLCRVEEFPLDTAKGCDWHRRGLWPGRRRERLHLPGLFADLGDTAPQPCFGVPVVFAGAESIQAETARISVLVRDGDPVRWLSVRRGWAGARLVLQRPAATSGSRSDTGRTDGTVVQSRPLKNLG